MDQNNYYQGLAVLFGEMRGQPQEAIVNVGSSLVNRFDNFDKYWGWRGTYGDMLREEYYAIRDSESGKNTGYADAMNFIMNKTPFKTEDDESDFKRVMQIWKGLNEGTIERTNAQFYFTPSEEKKQRKAMNFDLLKETGVFKDRKGKQFNTYAYK